MNPQFIFYQGSTPTMELVLPLELQAMDIVYATFAQDNRAVLEYQINGTPADIPPEGYLSRDVHDGRTLFLHMTQADTLRLETGDVELQLRVVTDEGADTFIPVFGYIGKAQKEGVIE